MVHGAAKGTCGGPECQCRVRCAVCAGSRRAQARRALQSVWRACAGPVGALPSGNAAAPVGAEPCEKVRRVDGCVRVCGGQKKWLKVRVSRLRPRTRQKEGARGLGRSPGLAKTAERAGSKRGRTGVTASRHRRRRGQERVRHWRRAPASDAARESPSG